MQLQNDRRPWNVRALLESTATPFTIADYGPRDAIFRQGDPCDSVLHIERGRVWLAVTARSGKEAICGLLDTDAFLGEETLTGLRRTAAERDRDDGHASARRREGAHDSDTPHASGIRGSIHGHFLSAKPF